MIENSQPLVTPQLGLTHVAHLNGGLKGSAEAQDQLHSNQTTLMAKLDRGLDVWKVVSLVHVPSKSAVLFDEEVRSHSAQHPLHPPLASPLVINPNEPFSESCVRGAFQLFRPFLVGSRLRFVLATSRSCRSLIDEYIPLDAPRSDDLDFFPLLAAKAAPAAICCFLDLAGID